MTSGCSFKMKRSTAFSSAVRRVSDGKAQSANFPRRGLLAGMNGLEDTLGGIETWYYMEVLRGGPVQTPDDARRALLAVTREDVRDILKQFTLSVSCLLTREEGNENG